MLQIFNFILTWFDIVFKVAFLSLRELFSDRRSSRQFSFCSSCFLMLAFSLLSWWHLSKSLFNLWSCSLIISIKGLTAAWTASVTVALMVSCSSAISCVWRSEIICSLITGIVFWIIQMYLYSSEYFLSAVLYWKIVLVSWRWHLELGHA